MQDQSPNFCNFLKTKIRSLSFRWGKRSAAAHDLVKRNFRVPKIDQVWIADIKHVTTREGFLYLAFILDVPSRRIVGRVMEDHLRTEIVIDALQMARSTRQGSCGMALSWRGNDSTLECELWRRASYTRMGRGVV